MAYKTNRVVNETRVAHILKSSLSPKGNDTTNNAPTECLKCFKTNLTITTGDGEFECRCNECKHEWKEKIRYNEW